MNRRTFAKALLIAPFALSALPTSAKTLWTAKATGSYDLVDPMARLGLDLYGFASTADAHTFVRKNVDVKTRIPITDVIFDSYDTLPTPENLPDQTIARHVIGESHLFDETHVLETYTIRDRIVASAFLVWFEGDTVLDTFCNWYRGWVDGFRDDVDVSSSESLESLLPTSFSAFPNAVAVDD